jgi:hypothetical protein
VNPLVVAALSGTLVQLENKKVARRNKKVTDDTGNGGGSSFVEGAKIEVPVITVEMLQEVEKTIEPAPVTFAEVEAAVMSDSDPGDVTDPPKPEPVLDAANSVILEWSTQKHGVASCANHTVRVPVTAKYISERTIYISKFASVVLPGSPPTGVYELADEDSTGLRTYRLPHTIFLPKR